MPIAVAAKIEHGTFPSIDRPIAESNLLINSVKIKAAREKKEWKGVATRAVERIRYTNPTLTFTFDAYISAQSGFGSQHPGSAVTTLANFASTYRTFAVADGVMVYEDPEDDCQLDDMVKTTFTIIHYPFVAAA